MERKSPACPIVSQVWSLQESSCRSLPGSHQWNRLRSLRFNSFCSARCNAQCMMLPGSPTDKHLWWKRLHMHLVCWESSFVSALLVLSTPYLQPAFPQDFLTLITWYYRSRLVISTSPSPWWLSALNLAPLRLSSLPEGSLMHSL